ncbi:MAG TPA: hypothetical protein VE033_11075 [Acetobacteraceae bacterium]|jgi:predicted trehalose synthase|nr:hypothetical protein [Acetobacteraceae bacterium]
MGETLHRSDTAPLVAFPQSPEARLRLALRRLDEALAEQAEAVALFRREIGGLGEAVAGLHHSALALRDTLDEAAGETAQAHQASLRLLATAEEMQVRA